MCLIFFALKQHPDYKLIIAGNRDEFYKRKTSAAAFWPENPSLLAGRDLEAMGTWLGITKQGRISMLTNYRDPVNINPTAPSRGKLVSDFLMSDTPPETYLLEVAKRGSRYNGFNLVAGNESELWYYSNYGGAIEKMATGYHGLSNHLMDTPWPKVQGGKSEFARIVIDSNANPDMLLDFLYNEERAADDLLPNTGLALDWERALSSMFIKTTGYGSRSSTVILINQKNEVSFTERVYNTETFTYTTQTFSFTIGA
jgi:uncharacterized protein with NRDE domain